MQSTKKTRPKVKRGRPPMAKHERRSARLILRVTPKEHADIAAAARRRGVTITDLLIAPWRKNEDRE